MNFFSVKKTYDRNLYNHIKGGIPGKIVTLILFLVFAGASLVCEWWAIAVYGQGFFWGVLASIVALGLIVGVVQQGFTYCVVCFKSTVISIFESVMHKIETKALEKQMKKDGNAEIVADQIVEEKPKRKQGGKGFDIFLGIMYFALSLAEIALAIYVFVHYALGI